MVFVLTLGFMGDEESNISIEEAFEAGLDFTLDTFRIVILIMLIWGFVSFYFQKDIMFGFSWAKPVTRKQNPKIYNIVENLCISQGIQPPKVGIIEDDSLNAFATGRNMDDSRIVFTRGLLNTLNDREIEAVAGHELTHLLNKDCKLMFVGTVVVGVVSLIGEILARSSSRKDENGKGGALVLIGFALLILGNLIYPVLRLAISRKKEYLADLGSVELTHNGDAMISALEKISWRSEVKGSNKQIAMFYIETPTENRKKESSSLFDTHPSIDERIDAIRAYMGW